MERHELLRSRAYWTVQIQIKLFNLIEDYRKKNNMTKAQIAEKLGVSKGYITQILNGDFDHKISKLVDLSLAFGKVPLFIMEDIDQYIEDDNMNVNGKKYWERPIYNIVLDRSIFIKPAEVKEKEHEEIWSKPQDEVTYNFGKLKNYEPAEFN